MDILTEMEDKAIWMDFFQYRSGACRLSEEESEELSAFIEEEGYLPVLAAIRRGEPFPQPRKAEISKQSSSKKRTVYIYPPKEAMVLKVMNHLLLRRYDHLFSGNLYSFRAGHGVKEAVMSLSSVPNIGGFWSYKADIRNYFNSVPVEAMLTVLDTALSEDPLVAAFLGRLLRDPVVLENGRPVEENKGIMAGCPVSTFLANLYLSELDWEFRSRGWLYARYSDDIILFAPTKEELCRRVALVHRFIAQKGLTINPEKEAWTAPGEQWIFLGAAYCNGEVDVSPVSVEKIKAKMRRKKRALQRWADRKGVPGTYAAKAFIRTFNQKLFENPISSDLTWARWFFPLITTDRSLRVIDAYAQQCIRILATHTVTKARYNFRYADMKSMGYRSLVHEYYSARKDISCCNFSGDGL